MVSKFNANISDIIPENQKSWHKKVFLTCDIDWAPDEVIDYTVKFIKENAPKDAKVTFLVTHETDILQDLQNDDQFELGIHPNFNNLLDGTVGTDTTSYEIIENLMKIVPEAQVIRNHSCVTSFRIEDLFTEFGLSFNLNHFIPMASEITLKPWYNWNRLIQVPYIWQDDMYLMYGNSMKLETILSKQGICVINFHPIHLFLNTKNMTHYQEAKKSYHNYNELKKFINPNDGIKLQLRSMLNR